jgi:hypothetical protein
MKPRGCTGRPLPLCGFLLAAALASASAAAANPPARVEARSADLLAVGLVQGDRMIVHLSRVLDNSPVRDAALSVVLRGASHPSVAEADGSYLVTAKDLTLPGDAIIEFNVVQAEQHESLKGVLKANAAAPDDHGNARQMWWWALNFGVCAGFLVLWSRRKKGA